jgi:hypothetical protein
MLWLNVRAETANRPAQRCRRPLHLELLEERTLPTILFSSSSDRQVVDMGGPVSPSPVR